MIKLSINPYDGFATVRFSLRWRIRFHFQTAVLSFLAGVLCAGPLLIFGAIFVGNLSTPARAAMASTAPSAPAAVTITWDAAAAGGCVIAANETAKTWRYMVRPDRGEIAARWIPFGYTKIKGDCRPAILTRAART